MNPIDDCFSVSGGGDADVGASSIATIKRRERQKILRSDSDGAPHGDQGTDLSDGCPVPKIEAAAGREWEDVENGQNGAGFVIDKRHKLDLCDREPMG